MIRLLIIILIALAVIAGMKLANAQAQVRVIDGDTVELAGTKFRLWAIDAPELKQTCAGWPAGALAKTALELMTNGREITCEPKSTDRYGRTVALCRADGRDLGAAMVKLGMAWAFRVYSRDYVEQEEFARNNLRGVHAYECQPAWIWRAERR